MLTAVVLPMPFGPRSPITSPFFGTGMRNKRKAVFLECLGQSDDSNRVEGIFADTDSTRYAGFLADDGLRGLWVDPDDLRPGPLRRTERDALEVTALRLAPGLENDRT